MNRLLLEYPLVRYEGGLFSGMCVELADECIKACLSLDPD